MSIYNKQTIYNETTVLRAGQTKRAAARLPFLFALPLEQSFHCISFACCIYSLIGSMSFNLRRCVCKLASSDYTCLVYSPCYWCSSLPLTLSRLGFLMHLHNCLH